MHPHHKVSRAEMDYYKGPDKTQASIEARKAMHKKLGPVLGLGRKKPEPKKPTFRPLMGGRDHA